MVFYAADVQTELEEVIEALPDQSSYQPFLYSRVWKNLKGLVLKRANGLCEACLKNRAISVHHDGYEFGRLPPAWKLRAVCSDCHQRFHVKTILRDDWRLKNGNGF